jgi:hypothetical protein
LIAGCFIPPEGTSEKVYLSDEISLVLLVFVILYMMVRRTAS